MRRKLLLLLAVCPTLLLAGCTKVDQTKGIVTDAIDRTEQVARQFTYADRAGGHSTAVLGDIQDDFRYALAAFVDGRSAATEVVVDDARAMQVTDQALLPGLSSGSGAPTTTVVSAGQTVTTPAAVPDPLKSGQWVVDSAGAVGLTATSSLGQAPGRDPFFDAISALEYVRNAVNTGLTVTKFNPESEAYRPKLDPFPHPQGDVIRYDVVPPILQPKSSSTGQVQLQLPDTSFFRIMAIYVKNGLVVDVREKIDILTRLEDVQSNLEARIGDFNVSANLGLQQQANALLRLLNQELPRIGRPALRLRTMELSFTSLGSAQPVSIPANATPGNLSAVDAHGQLLYEQH